MDAWKDQPGSVNRPAQRVYYLFLSLRNTQGNWSGETTVWESSKNRRSRVCLLLVGRSPHFWRD